MVLSRKTAAQTMAPAVTAIVTTCQFDRRNSLTAMLRRVRRMTAVNLQRLPSIFSTVVQFAAPAQPERSR
jgi:hypothetical protein